MEDQLPSARLTVLHAEAYQFPASWRFPPTVVPYSIARMVTGGSGLFIVDHEECPVLLGDVVLVPEGSTLECLSTSTSTAFAFISIRFTTSASIAGRDFLSEHLGLQRVTPYRGDADMLRHFEDLASGWAARGPGRAFLLTGHLNLIVGALSARAGHIDTPGLARLTKANPQTSVIDPRIESIVDRLSAHPRSSPNIKQLCAQVHLSESALRRLFKAQMGKTISDYHRDLRMMAVARELLLTDRRIGDIAHDFGYHDANYFARVFHNVFGLPPTSYRRLIRLG